MRQQAPQFTVRNLLQGSFPSCVLCFLSEQKVVVAILSLIEVSGVGAEDQLISRSPT